MSGEFELNLSEFNPNFVWREANLASILTVLSQI